VGQKKRTVPWVRLRSAVKKKKKDASGGERACVMIKSRPYRHQHGGKKFVHRPNEERGRVQEPL